MPILQSRAARSTALLACFAALWLGGCASAKGPGIGSLAQQVNATRLPPQAVIAPGDRFTLFMPGMPDDGVGVLVLEDGTASFGVLGSLEVAGLLVPQLRERLVARYNQLYDAGEPALVVAERGARQVHVLGEVALPGAIDLRPDGRMTLPEAMARAGGFLKQSAWLSNTLLVRWDPVGQRQLAWKIDARPEHWDDGETIFLQPFDLIYVPNTPIDRVALWVDNYIRRLLPIPILVPTS